ncbi:hypothetical protein BCE75_108154 [Isoptericola sp. CG 20/1183]|uniref:SPW repeat-containing protein n=1 Tax=Isoptericola halotolerans TaxID=300560 RepID=A0ABX5ECQ5_9MICO|nr:MULTISPECIES: hypothetical protein [Isoptericola]PRZ05175.1 hypothetical protein BCL65_108155 [Isoptericola halotolerans]PRZ05913.1 hypothetical protein BCE75_108154 [Isoptericola sp. CG 20/1183]
MDAPSSDSPTGPGTTAAARRVGYVLGVLVNVLLLVLVHGWPGWESVPFLTPETAEVLGEVDAAIVVGIVANLGYLVADPPWLRALGDVVTAAVGLVATIAVWNVFPFEFTGQTFPWDTVLRVLLVAGMVGSVVAIVVALVRLARGSRTRSPAR